MNLEKRILNFVGASAIALSLALGSGCAGGGNSGGGSKNNNPQINTPPVLAELVSQNFLENSGFHNSVVDLWQYASDQETPDAMLSYAIIGQTNPSIVDCNIDSNRYIDCTVKTGIGSSDITVQVADPKGETVRGAFTVNVNPIPNNNPVISGLPDKVFPMNSGLKNNMLDIWQYASDKEDSDSMLVYSITNQTNSNVANCNVDSNRYIDCMIPDGASGISEITVRVEDTRGATAEDIFSINVNDDPSTCPMPVGCKVNESSSYSLIPESFNTLADIVMGANALPTLSRFSMSPSVMLPEIYDSKEINQMVMTLKTDKGYKMIWFDEISSVDRECSKTRINLQNGESLLGTFVSNSTPRNFYYLTPGEIRGLMNIEGVAKTVDMYAQCVSNLAPDMEGSQVAFELQKSEILSNLSAPVSIELRDGTTVSTDLGFIQDFCGHYYSNTFHTRLLETLETIGPDGITSAVPLGDVSEIEFTGEFDATYPQARKIIVSYKDGRKENSSLYLTSESYGGVCNTSSRFRNQDGIIMYDNEGAEFYLLDNVKKIKPNQQYVPPKDYIQNKSELEGIVITSWQLSEYSSSKMDSTLLKLRDMGVESVALLVTQYQDTKTSTDIYALNNSMNATPSDDSIRHAIRDIKRLGMKPVLKPHVDCLDGSYRGDINFGSDESAWSAWFTEYNAMMMHYAEIAQQEGVELIISGTELDETTQKADWNSVIQNIRSVYTGKIAYAANWDSYRNVGFVDKLDFLGVDAYNPITSTPNASQEVLDAGWQGIRAELADYSAQIGKKILLTEVGYQDKVGTSIHPWWTATASSIPGRDEQARCYRAMFKSVHNGYNPANADVFEGIYIWNENYDFQDYNGFAIVGKPAGDVVSEVYHLLDAK